MTRSFPLTNLLSQIVDPKCEFSQVELVARQLQIKFLADLPIYVRPCHLMTLSRAFELYRTNVIVFRNQSSKTEEHHLVTLRSIMRFIGRDIAIEELDFEIVRQWKLSLEKRKLSPGTVRGYIGNLRVVLGFLTSQGIECLKPAQIPLPKRFAQVPVFITPAEVSQLINAIGLKKRGYPLCNRLRNQAIVSLLYGSGIRIGELCRMNRTDIYDRTFTVVGKGSKVRLCFIDERTEKLIIEYSKLRGDNNEALFLSNQTKARIRPDGIQKMMNDGWKKAGLSKPIHPHSLRHSYATDLMRNGMHIYSLSRLLGHSSIQTTQQYLHVTDINLKEDFERYHTV